MSELLRVTLLASLLVIVFDTVGSIASRQLRFSYVRLMPASFLIYGGVGFLAASFSTLIQAGLAASIVGLVDATVGWAISWAIGPGRLPKGQASLARIVNTIVIVVTIAGVLGVVGGFVSSII